MKALGAVLVLLCGLWSYLLRRAQTRLPLTMGRALLGELAVLRHEICAVRRPLPELLERGLLQGPLWESLGCAIRRGEGSLPVCWQRASEGLPQPLDRLLAPIGPHLPQGGEALGHIIDETREELTEYIRTTQAQEAMRGRLTAALCLSGAGLLVLVLL